MESFEETYAQYLELLAKLDETDDMTQKNVLFRELATLLSEMENSIKSKISPPATDKPLTEDEMSYWI